MLLTSGRLYHFCWSYVTDPYRLNLVELHLMIDISSFKDSNEVSPSVCLFACLTHSVFMHHALLAVTEDLTCLYKREV